MNDKLTRLCELFERANKDRSMLEEPIDETNNSNNYFNGNLVNCGTDEQRELIDEIDELLNDVMITDQGRPNYDAIRKAKSYGIHVFAGETDSFGWLTGCAQYKNGPIFVFG